LGGPGRADRKNSLRRAGLSKSWATMGRAGPWKMARFRGLAYSLVALFFIMSKILSDQFSTVRKRYFFSTRWIHFFSFHLFVTWYLLFTKKNKIHHKMQREKPYGLYKTAYLNCILLAFKKSKILCDCSEKIIFFYTKINFLLLISYIK